MTPQESALAAAWIAEMWAPVREVPADVRAGWAALAVDRNARLGETRGEVELPFTERKTA
jgi:hypothetical protein